MNFYYVQSDDKYAFAKYIDGGEKNYICESCKRVYQIDRISDFQVQFIGKNKPISIGVRAATSETGSLQTCWLNMK